MSAEPPSRATGRSPPEFLTHVRATQTDDEQAVSDDTENEVEIPKRRILISPSVALALAALEAVLPSAVRRLLRRGKPLALVIAVPSGEWVPAMLDAVRRLSCARPVLEVVRDGADRKHQANVGNNEVSAALARGDMVIGISPAPARFLPSVLTASADVTIRTGNPDSSILANAMRKSLRGRVPKELPNGLTGGLSFYEIVGAMRRGNHPKQVIARLRSLADKRAEPPSGTAVPRLQDAIYYGEARDWGLALAQDVSAARCRQINWSDVDRGAIFFGEPGTGKTWLAHMIADECRLPFIESSVAELFASSAGHLDSVIKAQRAVFERAAAAAPCVLFWDEIEAMPHRGLMSPRGRDWWLPVVDDFLLQVASMPAGVIQIGATNYLELVDPALCRPGRMERAIEIKAPATAEGLVAILRFHLGEDLAHVDLVPLARLGVGATAAAAMGWVRQARRRARTTRRAMIAEDLIAAIAPADQRTPDAMRRSAIHEAGHAVAALTLGLDRIQHLSLVRRNGSGGRLTISNAERTGVLNRTLLEAHAMVALAGRTAEVVCLGSASTGAGGNEDSDLAIATRILSAIQVSLGLGDSLIYRVALTEAGGLVATDRELRATVEKELQCLHARTMAIIEAHRRVIEVMAQELLSQRVLTGAEVERLFMAAQEESRNAQAR